MRQLWHWLTVNLWFARCAKQLHQCLFVSTLDVIEATRWNGDSGVYLNSWGPGPYYIRIAVTGLQAKAEDLKARGTRFTWIEESEAVGGKSLIRVDPADVRGQLFEFEEY